MSESLPSPNPHTHPEPRGSLQTLLTEARTFVNTFRVLCPSCSTARPVSKVRPRQHYRWAVLTCTNRRCCSRAPANKWRCACNVAWRLCTVHSRWEYSAKLLHDHTQPWSAKRPSVSNQSTPDPPLLPPTRRRRGHFDDPAPAPPLRGESSSASSRKRPRPPDPRLLSTCSGSSSLRHQG